MKKIDVIMAGLLIIGGLNWGLVGSLNIDLVATLFGSTIVSSAVYVLVGASAIYQILQWRSIHRRWMPVSNQTS